MKKEITLQFSSLESLWHFWNDLSCAPAHVSIQTKTITYRLSEDEVHLAIVKYNAQIIDEAEVQNYK